MQGSIDIDPPVVLHAKLYLVKHLLQVHVLE